MPATYCNAEDTEENFWDYVHFGNHSTVDEDPKTTKKAAVKDHKKSYSLACDLRLLPLVLNCKVTPIGIVNVHDAHKKPRPIFNSTLPVL